MNTRSEASAPVIDEGLIKRLFGEFGVFRMARTGWLGSNNTAKVQEVIETETQLRAALEAGCAGLVAENALLKRAFLAGHAEGWTGNQQRRDVQHVDAEKSWNLYVENGALNKSRTALRGDREQGEG